MTWYASVDGGRSAFSVDAPTREAARGVASNYILNPNADTHPGMFFELRANIAAAERAARRVVIYTTQEWDEKEHALMIAEGRAVVGADGKLELNKDHRP